MLKSRVLVAGAGAFVLAGQAATLTYVPVAGAYTLVANAGAFVLSGKAAQLRFVGGGASGGFFDYPDRPRRKRRVPDDVEIVAVPGLGVEVYHAKPITKRQRKALRLDEDSGLEAIGLARRKAQLAAEDELLLRY